VRDNKFERLLGARADLVYLVLRVVVGLLFAFHGAQKVFGILSDEQPPVGSQMWIGGVIELVTGSLIALGLFTAIAAFLASGTMAVAYVQFHWKFATDAKALPAINHGELALVYALLFLFIACEGAGDCSLDGLRRRRGV
jgi:putative oxidoreductase